MIIVSHYLQDYLWNVVQREVFHQLQKRMLWIWLRISQRPSLQTSARQTLQKNPSQGNEIETILLLMILLVTHEKILHDSFQNIVTISVRYEFYIMCTLCTLKQIVFQQNNEVKDGHKRLQKNQLTFRKIERPLILQFLNVT